ncbi:MAG TPA: hypothetical protein VFM82_05325 [Flavobacteriaceae bacterium]|nr:hypothetical protein [Flavobacteriaceae bacterium]
MLLELARMLSENHKEVEIIDSEKEKDYPISKNVPNKETLRTMGKTSKRIDLIKTENHEDLMKKLLS